VVSFMNVVIARGSDGKHSRSVLSFDAATIPDTVNVTRAYLTVTYSSSSGDPWATVPATS
jgi:hypothetical protein